MLAGLAPTAIATAEARDASGHEVRPARRLPRRRPRIRERALRSQQLVNRGRPSAIDNHGSMIADVAGGRNQSPLATAASSRHRARSDSSHLTPVRATRRDIPRRQMIEWLPGVVDPPTGVARHIFGVRIVH
jgi:hypothetical protein